MMKGDHGPTKLLHALTCCVDMLCTMPSLQLHGSNDVDPQ